MERRARALAAVWLLAGLAACGAGNGSDASRYHLVLNDEQLMNWVLDPAADVIWASAGSIITEAGEQDLAPVDDAGWAQVRDAAAVLVEGGNLLRLPGRSEGADWDEFASGMTQIAEGALAASEARDADALFDLGGQLYNVCVACHQQYAVGVEELPAP
jgi:hypothetical protein